MVNSYLLAKILNYNNYSVSGLARVLQMDKKQVKFNLIHGVWKSNELEMLLHILDWPIDPMKVFFSTYEPDESKRF